MVPTDLNIAFQGLALIQGQIYNPVFVEKPKPLEPIYSVGLLAKKEGGQFKVAVCQLWRFPNKKKPVLDVHEDV